MTSHIGLEADALKAYLSGMSEITIPLADVLLPLAVEGPYSYRIPVGMRLQAGSYVEVPLGTRNHVGVVWNLREASDSNLKLRDVGQHFDLPPMPDRHRQFIAWLANYYLEPLGKALRLVLRVPSAFAPEQKRLAYVLGNSSLAKVSAGRARVLEVARTGLAFTAAELAAAAGVTAPVIKAMAKQGALKAVALPAHRPFQQPKLNPARKILTAEQKRAAALLRAVVSARSHKVMLLDGVTGSGKTEVYFEAMAAALAAGSQVLLLLPEIALTGGFLSRVEDRFGAVPAGWHSDMGPRERDRVWRGVTEGRARIVVGARSALFLPWQNLGLIVVDEEHDSAYKQSDGVPYHARDMAVLYGTIGKFPVILASATPSLESLVNVDRARYGLVKLQDRHGRPELPTIDLLDMRQEKLEAGNWLSQPLMTEVRTALDAGDQALLFLNRRGYAPLTLCRACGHRLDCPHCAASLVEHRFRNLLMCHHCGHREPIPKACPTCATHDKLTPVGPGVERLAEEAMRLFPQARLAILSSDLSRGEQLRDVLRDVANGVHNLVIGTQLVAKGHHFPYLTFVGVVDADLALESSDPRAGERTWAMLAQVAGRSGRGQKPGRALVQTYSPNHPLMQALKRGDRDAYLSQEKRLRQAANLPPFARLALVSVSARNAADAERFARSLAESIPPTDDLEVLGPAPAPIAVIRGRHRFRFLVKAKRGSDLQGFLRHWLGHVKPKGNIALQIDVDPYNFM